ncbi:MAG: helix-turn-helix domain-containing protein [Clostridiales bacterium]|nr:helix-turn-helix domain-containing protein [Clostridiales bacterium]
MDSKGSEKINMPADIKKAVGERLKESRSVSGFTQAQVAKRLYMTQQQYSRFENGIFELNYSQIVFLCKLYDVSADYLLGLSGF